MSHCITLSLSIATLLASMPIAAFAQPSIQSEVPFNTAAQESTLDFPEGDTNLDFPVEHVTDDDATPYSRAVHRRTIHRNANLIRVTAQTSWPGVKHFTQAYMTRDGKVIRNSGRKWGRSNTYAATGYASLAYGPIVVHSRFGR